MQRNLSVKSRKQNQGVANRKASLVKYWFMSTGCCSKLRVESNTMIQLRLKVRQVLHSYVGNRSETGLEKKTFLVKEKSYFWLLLLLKLFTLHVGLNRLEGQTVVVFHFEVCDW